jgi:hypothetical protein
VPVVVNGCSVPIAVAVAPALTVKPPGKLSVPMLLKFCVNDVPAMGKLICAATTKDRHTINGIRKAGKHFLITGIDCVEEERCKVRSRRCRFLTVKMFVTEASTSVVSR